MKYKGKLKSLEEIVNSFVIQDVHTTFLKFVINNQDKIIEVIRLNDDSDEKFMANDRFCFLKENFSELEEIKENEVWKPETGERFFSIGCDGRIFASEMNNYDLSIDLIKNYNSFKTFEQAEQVKKVIKLAMAQMAWKLQNDDNITEYTTKYFIQSYANEYKVLYMDYVCSGDYTKVYFTSKEKAKQCLEFLKKEGLL